MCEIGEGGMEEGREGGRGGGVTDEHVGEGGVVREVAN